MTSKMPEADYGPLIAIGIVYATDPLLQNVIYQQQSSHPEYLETAEVLFRVPNSLSPSFFGRVTFSGSSLPPLPLVMTDSLLLLS